MNEREIFMAAIHIEDPTRCEAFLDQACGQNHDLRSRVEVLLQAHRQAGAFLDPPAANTEATVHVGEITESPGEVIGNYKLREQIGAGGMGVVYVAEQERPVRRKVALKIIKPGMDTKEVIARFEAERQALALMNHPNIANVLDAGCTDSARPYFVMELVNGIPITEYCDRYSLSTVERLELFMPICKAVQHAHQKGVIHRDLKPSNVLVTEHDGTPVAKIIDFGVAKAVNQRLTEHTVYTRFQQMVGTPMYMSPEQAELSGLDVDTRTDIYSLGVLLYELLTGTTPFDRQRFNEAAYDEMRRIIREEEPMKPSTRVSSLGDTATSICAQRRCDVRKLHHFLHGDLDWIVMKAMEKDRSRRYESANGLARDLERFLQNEPVEACPPSVGYRFRKFARRNKAAIVSVSAVCLALVAGLCLTTIGFVSAWEAGKKERAQRLIAENEKAEADRQRAEAVAQRLRADRLRSEADQQREEAERQKQVAEENFQRARDAVDTFLTKVSEDELVNRPGLQPLRKELLALALKYYQQFIQERQDDPRLLKDLAAAHYRVGHITGQIGSPQLALEEYQKAKAILESLATETDPQSQVDLAALYDGLARLQRAVGETGEAEGLFRLAIDIWTALLEQRPDVYQYQQSLASSYNDLGSLHWDLGRTDQAIESYRRAIALRNKLAETRPEEPSFPVGYNNLARIYRSLGRLDDARALYEQGIDILRDLMQRYPDVLHHHQQLAIYYQNLALLHSDLGQTDEALDWHREAIEIIEALARQNADVLAYQATLASSYNNLALLHSSLGQTDEALTLSQKAIEIRKTLSQKNPRVYQRPSRWARSYVELAKRQMDAGKQVDAVASWGKAADLIESLPEPERSPADWGYLGRSLYYLGHLEKAREALEEANSLRGDEGPTHLSGPRWWYLAMTLHKLGEIELARSYYDQLVNELKENPSPYDAGVFQAEAAAVLGIAEGGDLASRPARQGQQRNDPNYQPEVKTPTFPVGLGPRVAVDEGHLNFHTVDGRYQGFAKLVQSDGYRVSSHASQFTAESLKDVDVLVVANARAADSSEDANEPLGDTVDSAFAREEIEMLSQWVRDGGSLLFIADHKPYGGAAKELAAEFGVQMTDGFAIDQDEPGPIVFKRSDRRLASHPITEGRAAEERIEQVVTFTGQAFRSTGQLSPLLILGQGSVLLPGRPGNLPSDADRKNVEGWLQGAAGEFGQGRIAVFGEAGMFSAQIAAGDGRLMGMNATIAEQNEQFLLNLMHWLSREL